jgi:histidyl-tRNA synthetase
LKFQAPPGTYDLLPSDFPLWNRITRAAEEVCALYGYRSILTPGFEDTELFQRTSGAGSDVVRKEMYTFEDQGGRSLTLRPEGTAPVVRAYLANRQSLPTPFKAYYIVPMFRHERPQAGRMRQHTQFGVEVVDSAAPLADVEVISVGHEFLRLWRLEFSLHLNSIGDETCRPGYREALIAFLEERKDRLDREHRERFRENPLRVLDCKNEECRAATEDAPRTLDFLCDACREHFDAVRAGLRDEGIEYGIDHRLVRGLDYYTRTAFEFDSDVLGPTQSTLCGGGRYDGLAEVLGGEPTAGVGFGLGLERVLIAMERSGLPPPESARGVFVVAIGEEARREARSLVRDLRDRNEIADMALEDRPLKGQLRMADRSGAFAAAILGDRELGEGVVTMRRLDDGSQETVTRDEVAAWLRR